MQCRPGRSRGGTCPGQEPPPRWTGPRWSSNSRSETSSYSHSSERRWGGRGYLSAPPPTQPTSWHGSGCPAWRCAGRTSRRRTPPRCSIVQTRRPRWQGNTIVQKYSLISSEEPGKIFPRRLALHLDLAETAMCVANFQNAGERRWKVLYKDLVHDCRCLDRPVPDFAIANTLCLF